MQLVILSGGLGARLREETEFHLRPTVPVGEEPFLPNFSGVTPRHRAKPQIKYHTQRSTENRTVTKVDTGQNSVTVDRVKRMLSSVKFGASMPTCGDGLTEREIDAPLKFYLQCRKPFTMTANLPPGRHGDLKITNAITKTFKVQRPIVTGIPM